jgi:hypothetical protein
VAGARSTDVSGGFDGAGVGALLLSFVWGKIFDALIARMKGLESCFIRKI